MRGGAPLYMVAVHIYGGVRSGACIYNWLQPHGGHRGAPFRLQGSPYILGRTNTVGCNETPVHYNIHRQPLFSHFFGNQLLYDRLVEKRIFAR